MPGLKRLAYSPLFPFLDDADQASPILFVDLIKRHAHAGAGMNRTDGSTHTKVSVGSVQGELQARTLRERLQGFHIASFQTDIADAGIQGCFDSALSNSNGAIQTMAAILASISCLLHTGSKIFQQALGIECNPLSRFCASADRMCQLLKSPGERINRGNW